MINIIIQFESGQGRSMLNENENPETAKEVINLIRKGMESKDRLTFSLFNKKTGDEIIGRCDKIEAIIIQSEKSIKDKKTE